MNPEDVFGKDLGTNLDKPVIVPLVESATEAIIKYNHFLTIEETKELWYYKDGVYVPGAEILIEKAVEKMYGYDVGNKHLPEIKGHIMRRTYHKREEIDADINIINIKNGLYDIDKGILLAHTPGYLSINQKSIVYDKNAKPRLFGKFLSQIIYPRDVRTAIDAIAYTFHRDYAAGRPENYMSLKELGKAGDSFNDVVSKLLKDRRSS